MVGASSDFASKFNEFMFYVGPSLQLLYWIVIAAASVFAALQFKRYVDFIVGGKKIVMSDIAANDIAASDATEEIDINKFVE
ncbi:MAG: hypothetical protein PF636_06190 [Actinomycetota bacterium]|jgi:hypothetical protein|nr:hypothetical protein [Actinomycetota bacterium]